MNTEEMNNDFESMLEESLNRSDSFETGDMVSGRVVFITDENVFVDISGKSEAIIEISEFREKDELTINKDDQIDAYVVSTSGGEIILTTAIGKSHVNSELLEIAYRNSIPVYGNVSGSTKGGYIVSISGNSCFCPFSQIDIKSPSDPEEMMNKAMEFRIIQFGERGKNIVLSRKALLEEAVQEKIEKLKKSLSVGDVVEGEIISIKDFGLFIDLGGLEALIPKSEISWSRYSTTDAYEIGQTVKAAVNSIDWEKMRISLSIKDITEDPWKTIDRYTPGETLDGRIVNIIKNGAFMEIKPGLEGFIHISKMSLIKRVNKPEDVIQVHDAVTAKLLDIDKDNKKISLELLTDEPDPWQLPDEELYGKIHTGIIEAVKKNGVNVRLENGMLGYIPGRELAKQQGSDIQKAYPVGNEIRVSIIDLEKEKKNLILSESAVKKIEEKNDFKKFMNDSDDSAGSTLGSMFKQQFDDIQKKIKD